MVQYNRFDSGGFVLHKVVVNSCRYSCWFDSSGKLIDCERVVAIGRTAAVSARCGKLRQKLQQIGNSYRGK